MTLDDLLDAWRTNGRVNRRLLDLCPDEALDLKPGGGKTIRSNWVHIVGVRRSHLEAMARAEAEKVPKLDWKTATREGIADALAASEGGIEAVLRRLDAKPNRWTTANFFGYCVAHEAHHRSQIEIALRLGGRDLEDAAMFSLWDWPRLSA